MLVTLLKVFFRIVHVKKAYILTGKINEPLLTIFPFLVIKNAVAVQPLRQLKR